MQNIELLSIDYSFADMLFRHNRISLRLSLIKDSRTQTMDTIIIYDNNYVNNSNNINPFVAIFEAKYLIVRCGEHVF